MLDVKLFSVNKVVVVNANRCCAFLFCILEAGTEVLRKVQWWCVRTFLIDNKSTVCHLDMGLCCIILYQNTDCKYLASIFTVLKNSPILQTKCYVFPSLMIMTLNANFIRSTWSKYWILSSSECGICSTKTFADWKFEDVLKCITSTDMIFWVTLLLIC